MIIIRIIRTNKMRYFLLVYFNNKPLHVSSRLAAHHEEDQLCISNNWYSRALSWLAAGRVGIENTAYDYTNCCLYKTEPPDDGQQVRSKHAEAYYWNKLIENSASCWFILYGYITMHGQQNFKYDYYILWSQYMIQRVLNGVNYTFKLTKHLSITKINPTEPKTQHFMW
jgi:hypothetical protein